MDLKSVLDEVESWPVQDRLRLIEEVWGLISASPESFVLSEPQNQDLRRRLDRVRAHPNLGASWEVVEARLRGMGR